MAYVLCQIDQGLRDSEVTVEIAARGGRSEFLRVDRNFVKHRGGNAYLPVGVISKNGPEAQGIALIELPHEADSGANRLWVPNSSVHDPIRL